jgi:hypothetical protein
MKWPSGVRSRVKAALLSIVIVLAAILTNRWERSNLRSWDDSFSAIYDDRLVPETYIFQLTDQLYRKRLLWSEAAQPDRAHAVRAALSKHDAVIDGLVKGFEATQLVDAESRALKELKARVAACRALEARWLATPSEELHAALVGEFDEALSHLSLLSRIQEQVGRELKTGSKSLLSSSTFLYQLEMALLVVMGLLIQFLVPTTGAAEAPKPIEPPRSRNSMLH